MEYQQIRFTTENDRDIPMDFKERVPIKVKCLDTERAQFVYMKCLPCPVCGKWLAVKGCGDTDRYCGWCGQRLKTRAIEEEYE